MVPSYNQKKSSRSLPRSRIVALRMLMINQVQDVTGRFPASLIYVADREPIAGCPVNPYAAPSRSTSAGLPVVLDTARLPCSPSPPAKETKSDFLCPDGCWARLLASRASSNLIVERGLYMLLRIQKPAVRETCETGNQAFSIRLRYLTIRDPDSDARGRHFFVPFD
jgi:hypothetical protein